jgi:hypothetical protein
VNATALVFELLEPVFLHERQEALHFRQVDAFRVRTCAGLRFRLLRHLEFEEISGSRRQIHSALRCHNHIILNADTANPFQVDPRFNGHYHPFLD